MKKVLSAILCLCMLASVCISFAGCGEKYDEDYTGPIIPVYFAEMPTTFDPHLAYLDNTAASVLSLMYEGLYKYDANGKVVKGLATGYKWIEKDDKTNTYIIEISIRETRWNDQVTVKADDFVYAWRRLLDPATQSPAASMLYMIDNAYEIRNAMGEITKFDLGAMAVDSQTLRITFAEKPNMDLFLEYLASPALVPLRDTAINKTGDNDWASHNAIVVANGPFYLKSLSINPQSDSLSMRLERNRYYKRCIEEDEEDLVDKYVLPYRLEFNFGKKIDNKMTSGAAYAYENYKAGEDLLNALLPLSARADEKGNAKEVDTMSTHTYVFNTENELFKNADVRKALSLALDRTKLAEMVVFAKAAEGVVPAGVFETTYKKNKDFRDVGGVLIKATADLDEAKALLNASGINKKTAFTITVKETDEVALEIAEYCANVWNKELGMNCSVRKLGYYYYNDINVVAESDADYDPEASEYENLIFDLYTACYLAGGKDVVIPERKLKLIPRLKNAESLLKGFDIIAVDMQQLSVDAFQTLAAYATYYNGGSIDLGQYNQNEGADDNAPIPADNAARYTSESYNKLIADAFAEKDLAKRAEILHKAEEALLADMPIMPLFVYTNGYLVSKELGNVKYTWGGGVNFAKVTYKNYVEPVEEIGGEEVAE